MRLVTVFSLLSSFFLISACDNQRLHDAYSGAPEQAVYIEANDTVLVTHIDAKEQDSVFIGQKNRYRIPPGRHTFIVQYAALFQLDADRHDKIMSTPIKVTFDADPGKTYRFRHAEQKSVQEARDFAKSPVLELIALPDERVINAEFEKTPTLSDVTLKSDDALESLKRLWLEASPSQRIAFQQWLNSQ